MRVLSKALLALIALTFSATAFADEPATTYELDIEAQALPGALKSFAEQTDLQVVYFASVAEGKDAPAIEGEYTADAALDQLLANADLEYQNVDARTYAIAPETAGDEGGASDPKNLSASPTPVLMAQNQTSPTASTEISRRSDDGMTSVVTGWVTDARTGANLRGAKITIVETGQWTSTGELGRFRLVNVPAGTVTLSVSFLGYAEQSVIVGVHGDGVTQDFALRGGSEIEEIVVFGQRSARALALNQERTAENSTTIIASDLLGEFGGTTIADALRKAPGVSFQRDKFTGEGSNIVIRGLGPDLNEVQLNGVSLPDGSGLNRSADLSNLLADSISTVKISKTLLPNQDSAGTGGLVEIETASPLDRGDRFLSLTAQGLWRQEDFGEDVLVSGTASRTFGATGNFGLLGSIQYRESSQTTRGYTTALRFGSYLPLRENGTPATSLFQLDPRLVFPFEGGDDQVNATNTSYVETDVETENFTVNLGAEWQVDDATSIRLDYVRVQRNSTFFEQSLAIVEGAFQLPRSIPELGGEERPVFVLDDLSALAPFLAVPNSTFLRRSEIINARPEDEGLTNTVSLRGTHDRGPWNFSGEVSYALGETSGESYFSSIQLLGPDPLSFGIVPADPSVIYQSQLFRPELGLISSAFGPRQGDGVPLPLLTEEGFAYLNDNGNRFYGGISNTGVGGEDEVFDIGFDVRYNFQGNGLKYIEAGFDYKEAEKRTQQGFFEDGRLFRVNYSSLVGALPLTDIGLGGTSSIDFGDISPGATPLEVLDRNAFEAFVSNIGEFVAQNPDLIDRIESELNPLLAGTSTVEEDLAAYFMGRYDIGALEIIGGVRISSVKATSTFADGPRIIDSNGVNDADFQDANRLLVEQSGRVTETIPRFLVNYRAGQNTVIRAGYFGSVARPRVRDLNVNRSLTLNLRPEFGPESNLPALSITQGNPELEPQYTHNLSVDFERYFSDAGVFKVGVFYKKFENYIENNQRQGSSQLTGVVLPDDPRFADVAANPQNYFITVNQPRNSDDNPTVWGLEVVLERQLTFLPGWLSGFGWFSNYTYSDSSRDITTTWSAAPGGAEEIVVRDQRFDLSPEHSGTAGITYNNYGFDGSLLYTYQSAVRNSLSSANFSLSRFTDEVSTLDGRLEYRFDRYKGNFRVFVDVSDILKSAEDADLNEFIGSKSGPKYYSAGTYRGGRTITLGMNVTF